MSFLPFGLSIWQVALISGFIIILTMIFFRRYTSAVISDFILDPVLSFVDEPLGGVLGLDFGDWIAAFIIYRREKNISGKGVALLAAWEATNFIPISLIPVVGTVVEVFTNFFPADTVLRAMFNKYRPAEAKAKDLEKKVSLGEEAGLDIGSEKKDLKRIREMIGKANPVGALKEVEKPLKDITSKIKEYADSLIADAVNSIQYITSQNIQAPQALINILEQGISSGEQLLQQARQYLEEEDFENAINSAVEAKNSVLEAAQQFDYGMQQLDEQMQNQQ